MNPLTLMIAVAFLLTSIPESAAQTVHKCTDGTGKVTYSDSPCPGAKTGTNAAVARVESGVLDIADMTQGHADLAADCEEVLENSKSPNWRERERESIGFNKYCQALGFRTPISPQNTAFNERHAKELMAKLQQRFDTIPSMSRTYSGGTRNPPTFSGAEFIMKQKVPPSAKALVTMIPMVQPGLWRVRLSRNENISQDESCGDPLAGLRSEIIKMQQLETLGCRISGTSPGPRKVLITRDCPADRKEGGRSIKKGKMEISVDSPTPQAITLMINTDTESQTVRSTRIGECKK